MTCLPACSCGPHAACVCVVAQSSFRCPPEMLFRIFTNPGELRHRPASAITAQASAVSCSALQTGVAARKRPACVPCGLGWPCWCPTMAACIPGSLLCCSVECMCFHWALPLPHADNTGVFRDIKKRGGRKVLELDPAGRKIVEVTRRLPASHTPAWAVTIFLRRNLPEAQYGWQRGPTNH